jgi:hypothetical protein
MVSSDSTRQAFRPSQRGVVGLVDDLLALCQEQELQLEWRANQCRVCTIGVGPEEMIEVPLPNSAFRAVLARLAALCNEVNPGSVSPYRGEAELRIGIDPIIRFRVAFTNTASEQRVQITRVHEDKDGDRLTRLPRTRSASIEPQINPVAE